MGVIQPNLVQVMERLSERRPIFHSEADFQHELAWELRSEYPDLDVRLERPLLGQLGATDIILQYGRATFGLELKYLTKRLDVSYRGESFSLKQQGAHPLRRYDVCKDISRLEALNRETGGRGWVLVLANDPAYWQRRHGRTVIDEQFRLDSGRQLMGDLAWGSQASDGTMSKRAKMICLSGSYPLAWRDYATPDDWTSTFKYLLIEVD